MTDLSAVYSNIDNLIYFAMTRLELPMTDVDWTRNRLLDLIGLNTYNETSFNAPFLYRTIQECLQALDNSLIQAGLLEEDDIASMNDTMMNTVMASPSAVQDAFQQREHRMGSMQAMQWFYNYCTDSTYVKRDQLQTNPRFNSHGLTITINQAKPEFKNMKTAAQGNSLAGGYPQCTICHENEGYAPRNKRTLRTIPLLLDGQPWFWQFSPYGYFNQHGICVNTYHTPMVVNRDTFVHLLDFVDQFPGYFLGCNAALPRIGGSVLAHDHYQGGGERMPMHRAQTLQTLTIRNYPDVSLEILDWPGSAIRLVSRQRESITEVSEHIRQAWVMYDRAALNIVSHDSFGNAQSALSPSVIITDRGYEMYLIFRNNAVSEQYPDGIFHAHPEYYAIKQEPIGLIEAQGLFILPGRLIRQLDAIKQALRNGNDLPEDEAEFSLVWQELNDKLSTDRDENTIDQAIKDELGSICYRILQNTAVFKKHDDLIDFLSGAVA